MTQEVAYYRFTEMLQYAMAKHAGQLRKGTGIPYIVHPVAVAETLARYNLPEHLVYAGLLHDVLEDTNVTQAELAANCGPEVADLVSAVSETKKDAQGQSRPWEIRKAEQLEHIRTAGLAVAQLKAADTLHNITSIIRDLRLDGNEVWGRFKAGKESQLKNYTELVLLLVAILGAHPLGAELSVALDQLKVAAAQHNA